MAKVTLPLGSFGARGKIGDAYVYFPWKGIACVREYIIPANPNTSDQQTQRGYFTSAVNEYHAAGYNEIDITAWRLKAAQSATPLTYFNQVVKDHVDALVAGKTWLSIKGASWTVVEDDNLELEVDCAEDKAAKLYYGVSPGYMPNEVTGAFLGGTWTFDITGLTASTIYYCYVKNTTAGFAGNTGIYKKKTAAA